MHSVKCAEFVIVVLNSGLIQDDYFEISPELNIRADRFRLTGAIKHKSGHFLSIVHIECDFIVLFFPGHNFFHEKSIHQVYLFVMLN